MGNGLGLKSRDLRIALSCKRERKVPLETLVSRVAQVIQGKQEMLGRKAELEMMG